MKQRLAALVTIALLAGALSGCSLTYSAYYERNNVEYEEWGLIGFPWKCPYLPQGLIPVYMDAVEVNKDVLDH